MAEKIFRAATIDDDGDVLETFGSIDDVEISKSKRVEEEDISQDTKQSNHLLYNIHRFDLKKDKFIDFGVICRPGLTNSGVTRQAATYIAYLNLLTIFDRVRAVLRAGASVDIHFRTFP